MVTGLRGKCGQIHDLGSGDVEADLVVVPYPFKNRKIRIKPRPAHSIVGYFLSKDGQIQ